MAVTPCSSLCCTKLVDIASKNLQPGLLRAFPPPCRDTSPTKPLYACPDLNVRPTEKINVLLSKQQWGGGGGGRKGQINMKTQKKPKDKKKKEMARTTFLLFFSFLFHFRSFRFLTIFVSARAKAKIGSFEAGLLSDPRGNLLSSRRDEQST